MVPYQISLRTTLSAGALAVAAFAPAAHGQDARAVITGYADLAEAMYGDSLATARALDGAIAAFVAAPSAESLDAAKAAWLVARVPYQQTEAYRFGNAVVDDWEGKVNAWPLDEGLIDYVDTGFYGDASDENGFFLANVVANPKLAVGGQMVDAAKITPALI